jgi:DNA replication and repair protein RecF
MTSGWKPLLLAMLTDLQLRNFRCFETLRLEFAPGFNFLVGANGEGKTSILEAVCVLLRLQSQRSASLALLVRLGQKSLALSGRADDHLLEFRYSALRRKVLFDGVEQHSVADYLRVGHVVSFANADIELTRGSSEPRRRYLDFLGAQINPRYRPILRAYERALRARNALLKSPHPRVREIAAYDSPLIENGRQLLAMRSELTAQLAPVAAQAHRDISGKDELLTVKFAPGNTSDLADELARSREEEMRLRQTVVGPHRDDLQISVQEISAQQYASEGQQRTVALALKIAQAHVLTREIGSPPILLLDDIFGELDPGRRNALLAHLPAASQKLVTATTMQWLEKRIEGPLFHLSEKNVLMNS